MGQQIGQHYLADIVRRLEKLRRLAEDAMRQVNDGQFFQAPDTRAALMGRWEEGWGHALGTIRALRPDDLQRTVTVRGEPHTVLEAINRQILHYAYHVGQIVSLAKHLAGPAWKTLSIPRGRLQRRSHQPIKRCGPGEHSL